MGCHPSHWRTHMLQDGLNHQPAVNLYYLVNVTQIQTTIMGYDQCILIGYDILYHVLFWESCPPNPPVHHHFSCWRFTFLGYTPIFRQTQIRGCCMYIYILEPVVVYHFGGLWRIYLGVLNLLLKSQNLLLKSQNLLAYYYGKMLVIPEPNWVKVDFAKGQPSVLIHLFNEPCTIGPYIIIKYQ
jgi:hypothetical protein